MMRVAGRGGDGLAKPFKTDNNGYLETISKKGNRPVSDSFIVTDFESGTDELVYETENAFSLEYFEIASNNTLTTIEIQAKRENGTHALPIGLITKNGTKTGAFAFHAIVNEASSLWDILTYDESGYKIGINRELNFPYGVRIRVRVTGGQTGVNIACRWYGVETE